MPRTRRLKNPISYQDQVSKLAGRDIIIKDPSACEDFLKHVNYYRLSGYIYPFLDHATDKCIVPVDFSRIADIYYFDAKLRGLITSTIECSGQVFILSALYVKANVSLSFKME